MKKSSLFFISLLVAVIITYSKRPPAPVTPDIDITVWNTFQKKSANKIIKYATTNEELKKSHLDRKIASAQPLPGNLFPLREDRMLVGENFEKYKDESIPLPMKNTINPEWKEALGNDLLRFQEENTKIIILFKIFLCVNKWKFNNFNG